MHFAKHLVSLTSALASAHATTLQTFEVPTRWGANGAAVVERDAFMAELPEQARADLKRSGIIGLLPETYVVEGHERVNGTLTHLEMTGKHGVYGAFTIESADLAALEAVQVESALHVHECKCKCICLASCVAALIFGPGAFLACAAICNVCEE